MIKTSNIKSEQFQRTIKQHLNPMNVFKRKSSEVTKPSLVAIREFNGTTSRELHHAIKWDRLEILDDSDVNWYEVINLRNNQTGLIPAEYCGAEGSLEVEEYVKMKSRIAQN